MSKVFETKWTTMLGFQHGIEVHLNESGIYTASAYMNAQFGAWRELTQPELEVLFGAFGFPWAVENQSLVFHTGAIPTESRDQAVYTGIWASECIAAAFVVMYDHRDSFESLEDLGHLGNDTARTMINAPVVMNWHGPNPNEQGPPVPHNTNSEARNQLLFGDPED